MYDNRSTQTENISVRHTGRMAQIGIHLKKLFRMFIYQSDWIVLPMSALIAGLVAFAVGANLFRTMEGTLMGSFAVSCICVWNGFFNSIQVICRERQILKREHRTGLHISSYVMAHMIYQAVICLTQVIITIVVLLGTQVSFPGKTLLTDSVYIDIGITMFLSIFCADMLALMVSAIAHSTTVAMTVMPFLLMIQLVFSGALFQLPAGVDFLTDLTVSKWSLTALCIQGDYNSLPMVSTWNTVVGMSDLEIEGQKPVRDVLIYIEKNDLREDFLKKSGELSAKPEYDFDVSGLLKCWGFLLLWTAVYAAVTVIFLEFIDRDKR